MGNKVETNTAAPTAFRNQAQPTRDSHQIPEADSFEYGEMNEEDAKESGYTDAKGHAVDLTKTTTKNDSPTGAYTDIGEGRSSVVRKK